MAQSKLMILALLIPLQLIAIHDPTTKGARSFGMGNIGVVGTGFHTVYNNQAAMAYFDHIAAGIDYDQGFFADHALSHQSAAFIFPTRVGAFGFNINYFGYAAYNEQKAGVAYGKQLGKKLALGVQLNYFRSYIGADYGSAQAVSFEIAIYSMLTKEIELGAHIFNPIGMKIGQNHPEAIPVAFRFGLLYHVDKNLILLSEIEKILDQKESYKLGLEYQISEHFMARTGLATAPTLFTFGFGLYSPKLLLDIGAGFHQTLGFTPRISLRFNIK